MSHLVGTVKAICLTTPAPRSLRVTLDFSTPTGVTCDRDLVTLLPWHFVRNMGVGGDHRQVGRWANGLVKVLGLVGVVVEEERQGGEYMLCEAE